MSEEFSDGISEQQIEEAAKTLMSGGTMRELKGLTADEVEAIYALGFNLYNSGKYDDADKVFRYLVLLDHTNAKYWNALGSVQQVRREFSKAVTSYAYASFLDLENPKPQYGAAQCFLAMGDKVNAESALAALEQYAPANSPYRAKAAELLKKIKA